MSPANEADFDPPGHRRQRLTIVLGIVTLSAMTAAAMRSTVVRLAPRTAVLFEASGIPVNLTGLKIDRVTAKIVADDERRILVVEGDLLNNGSNDETAKPLAVSVRGEGGEALYAWVTRAPQQKIAAGERAAFTARLASPPVKGVSVDVEFDRAPQNETRSAAMDPRQPTQR